MKQHPVRGRLSLVLLIASIIGVLRVPVYALVFDSTYNQVVNERDQMRKERDAAIQARIDDLKQGNPANAKQLEDARESVAAALHRTEAEQQRSGKWQSIAFSGTASCFQLGTVVGLAIGTKARRDHLLQKTANATAGTADSADITE